MKNLYTLEAINRLIDDCMKHGFSMETCRDGVLGFGKIVLVAPPGYWNFVIEEIPLNEWSSAHSVRKCREISKRLQMEIDSYDER